MGNFIRVAGNFQSPVEEEQERGNDGKGNREFARAGGLPTGSEFTKSACPNARGEDGKERDEGEMEAIFGEDEDVRQ